MKEYNWSVSITRIAATMMIVLCHFFSKIGIGWLGSIFDVGVPIFLIISGFLYGGVEHIPDKKSFYWKRWCRICIPMYIWLIAVVCMHCIYENYEVLKAIPVFIFNLQGIGWLQDYFSVPSIGDIGILWFFTVIFLCYILLPLFNKAACVIEKHVLVLFIIAAVIMAVNYIGIHLGYVLTFFTGYMMQKKGIKIKNEKQCIQCIFFTLVCQVGRLIFRRFLDDTVFYNYIVVYFSHLVFAGGIFLIIDYMVTLITVIKGQQRLIHNKFVKYFDRLSIYVYIVHYSFLRGVFAVDRITDLYMIWILLFFGITFASAVLLMEISDKVIRIMKKCRWI